MYWFELTLPLTNQNLAIICVTAYSVLLYSSQESNSAERPSRPKTTGRQGIDSLSQCIEI